MSTLSKIEREYITQDKNSSAARVEIQINPVTSLVDEEISINVTGLSPRQTVTLRAKLLGDSHEVFESYGHFIANGEGVVCVAEQEPLHGSYCGADAMGLMWSMEPSPGQRDGLRLSKKDVTKPYLVELQLYGGHVKDFHSSVGEGLQPITEATFEKWYMTNNVQRIPVREGRLRGALFLPPGEGPFPGVIDLFGTAGGLIEFKAALLASRGFAALALAYFAYDDLPSVPTDIELEYFFEAIDWMVTHPKILSPGLGLMGVSKGSEIALNVAAHRDDIKAVVGVSPAHAVVGFPIKYNGRPSDFVKFEPDLIRISPNGAIILRDTCPPDVTDDPGSTAAIEVENIQASILLIFGADDEEDPNKIRGAWEIGPRVMLSRGRTSAGAPVYASLQLLLSQNVSHVRGMGRTTAKTCSGPSGLLGTYFEILLNATVRSKPKMSIVDKMLSAL